MNSNQRRAAAALVAGLLAATGVQADTIRFWTTEEQPARLQRQQDMAAEFRAATGHDVEVIPVSEKDLGQRTTAAYAANDLPDVIYHTLQYVLPWAEAGILDVDTNNDIVSDLGRQTFAQGALDMAEFDGLTPAVPVDGWTQMVVYRKDWFDSYGLAPPDSYANIRAAIDALHSPPQRYGFVAATKVDENFMSQVLEHVFLANGLSPVDGNGFRALDYDRTAEVLEFYKALADASPPGELYWKQSRELYFAGRAAMIIWSPFILDELAGLRDSAPPTINDDPTSRDLAGRTSVVTTFGGPSNEGGAAWADIRFFGVTSSANTDVAADFVRYAMDEGYVRTLAIAPEGKFPVRRGDGSDPTRFVKAWSQLPVGVDRKAPLGDIYPQETIDTIVAGLETANRWGVKEGQLSLASKIINSQVLNRVVRQYIDGEVNAQEAISSINQQLARIN
ncbi:MAG: extracellular solute-binding protein [Betaproteobacteria bacterium AqS2]|uniref:Extracellular solute-binding protein n=1 Tax=Candidatus Amphirhobacter heronislandensis TaxID=1732024 RepID=A0A930UDF4_9GAMM|nr:extracellular solute-binding protein [Betaproteobacteria bacterium AqS2]